MLVRQGSAHSKQRTAPEAIEVEGSALWIADDFAGQEIVEPTTLFEMAQEGEKIAKEPGARARHGRKDRKAISSEHANRYAESALYLPVTYPTIYLIRPEEIRVLFLQVISVSVNLLSGQRNGTFVETV
jgi:hypothetical protein